MSDGDQGEQDLYGVVLLATADDIEKRPGAGPKVFQLRDALLTLGEILTDLPEPLPQHRFEALRELIGKGMLVMIKEMEPR